MKYIRSAENAQAIAFVRRQYVLRFRGKPVEPALWCPDFKRRPDLLVPVGDDALSRAIELVEPQYEEATEEVLGQIPTDRFDNQSLYVMGALAYAWVVQYPIAESSDSIDWNYTRAQLTARILDGSVLVDGARASYPVRSWGRIITEVQNTIESSHWLTRKPGHSGQATIMIPDDARGLCSLPSLTSSAPILTFPEVSSVSLAPPAASASDTGLILGSKRAPQDKAQRLSDRLQGH